MSKYDDIINYEYKSTHPKMPINRRASIFSPFNALTGYKVIIQNVEQDKDIFTLPSDDELNIINDKFNKIKSFLNKNYIITYYSDNKYKEIKAIIKKIDEINRIIILENNLKIPMDNITKINKI